RVANDGTVHGQKFADGANANYFLDPAATGTSLVVAGSVGIGNVAPASLLSVGSTSQFQVDSSGAIVAATGITNTGVLTSSGGVINLNASSNNAVNIGTGTTTSTVTLGGNSNNVVINSNTWDISGAGVASGLTGLSSSGTITFSAFAANGGLLFTNGSGTVAQTTVGTAGQCLTSAGGGSPTWSTCGGGSNWRISLGAISPINDTLDFLVGSSATSSARFAVTSTKISSNLPHEFTGAGDVSIAYDIVMTNQTASYLKSYGPLTIESGESFENNNLTLKTYGTGATLVDGKFGFGTQQTLPVGTTPSVTAGNNFITANVSSTKLITNFTNGSPGQVIFIEVNDAFTDFDCTGSNLKCGSTDLTVINAGDSIQFFYDGTDWFLLGWIDAGANLSDGDGADIAEYFPASEAVEAGDVVSIDSAQPVVVKKATKDEGQRVFGIVTTDPGIVLGTDNGSSAAVALAGRVPVKMNPNSAAIQPGDLLMASAVAGQAEKATGAAWVIGRALESWSPGNTDRVMVFVNSFYFSGNSIDSLGNLSSANLNQTVGDNYQVTLANGSIVDRVLIASEGLVANIRGGLATFEKIITSNLRSQQVATDLISPLSGDDITLNLESSQTDGTAGQLKVVNDQSEIVASIDGDGNATFSGVTRLGSLITDTVTTRDASVSGTATFSGQITAQSARIATLETQMAELDKLKARTAEIVTATISGTLYADDIYNFQDKVATALTEPSLLSQLLGQVPQATSAADLSSLYNIVDLPPAIASGSGTVNKSLAELNLSQDDVTLGAAALFINNYFEVNGNAYVAQTLGIGETLLIGHGTRIQDGVLEYINPTDPSLSHLAIQPSGRGSVSILAGLMTLDETGTVTITGNLNVAGAVQAETLLTNLVKPTDFGNPFQVQVAGAATDSAEIKKSRFEIINELGTPVATISAEGAAQFAGGVGIGKEDLTATSSASPTTTKSSGKATVKALTNAITINSNLVTDESLIYVTPIGSTGNKVLYVKAQTADNPLTQVNEASFTVGFDTAVTQDTAFNWWIVQ
nr:hypothetical protein [bacterium]